MQERTIGDVTVSAIGMGAMPLSVQGHPDRDDAILTIHAALDAGLRFIDTADAYAPDPDSVGHNEEIVAAALASWSGDADEVLVATKGGHTRTADGGWDVNGRPGYLRDACEASLRRLGVEAIGLYQHHRPDPAVPYEDTLEGLSDLLEAGKVRMLGISNANPKQIRIASELIPLTSVQNQFSPSFTSSLPELELCDELGLTFLPWSPLGGMGSAADLGSEHSVFAEVAEAHGVSPHQVALAWELALSPQVVPIPGASRPETILDSLQAADLTLSEEELVRLGEAAG